MSGPRVPTFGEEIGEQTQTGKKSQNKTALCSHCLGGCLEKGFLWFTAQLIRTGLGTSQGSTCLEGRDGLQGWLLGIERGTRQVPPESR